MLGRPPASLTAEMARETCPGHHPTASPSPRMPSVSPPTMIATNPCYLPLSVIYPRADLTHVPLVRNAGGRGHGQRRYGPRLIFVRLSPPPGDHFVPRVLLPPIHLMRPTSARHLPAFPETRPMDAHNHPNPSSPTSDRGGIRVPRDYRRGFHGPLQISSEPRGNWGQAPERSPGRQPAAPTPVRPFCLCGPHPRQNSRSTGPLPSGNRRFSGIPPKLGLSPLILAITA